MSHLDLASQAGAYAARVKFAAEMDEKKKKEEGGISPLLAGLGGGALGAGAGYGASHLIPYLTQLLSRGKTPPNPLESGVADDGQGGAGPWGAPEPSVGGLNLPPSAVPPTTPSIFNQSSPVPGAGR